MLEETGRFLATPTGTFVGTILGVFFVTCLTVLARRLSAHATTERSVTDWNIGVDLAVALLGVMLLQLLTLGETGRPVEMTGLFAWILGLGALLALALAAVQRVGWRRVNRREPNWFGLLVPMGMAALTLAAVIQSFVELRT